MNTVPKKKRLEDAKYEITDSIGMRLDQILTDDPYGDRTKAQRVKLHNQIVKVANRLNKAWGFAPYSLAKLEDIQ